MTPDAFVQRLLNHYGPPEHAADLAALKSDYVAAFDGADPAILQEASDRLLKAHQFRSWPTVGECRVMVATVADERAHDADRSRRGQSTHSREPSPEQRQRVSDLVRATTERMADQAKRRAGKPILHALYEEIHGRPYRKEDWA